MLETPHVLTGIAIATKVTNPLLAIPLALASHFALDVLPHWNPHINRELKKYGKPTRQSTIIVTIDSCVALGSGLLFAAQASSTSQSLLILFCALTAVLPDVVEAPYYFLGHKTLIIERWIKWQKSIQNDVDVIPGLLSQLTIIITALAWMLV